MNTTKTTRTKFGFKLCISSQAYLPLGEKKAPEIYLPIAVKFTLKDLESMVPN